MKSSNQYLAKRKTVPTANHLLRTANLYQQTSKLPVVKDNMKGKKQLNCLIANWLMLQTSHHILSTPSILPHFSNKAEKQPSKRRHLLKIATQNYVFPSELGCQGAMPHRKSMDISNNTRSFYHVA